MFVAVTLLALLTTAVSAFADSRTVTFYSDGALVEVVATVNKGVVDIPLPSGVIKDSLRIKPLGNSSIQRVDILTANQEVKGTKELDLLLEQKSRLEDRLQALSTREDIFKAAAKSQGGKAPRKTKSNPDPMQSIRQGTDFAIAQLEAVYTARRKAEQEIRRLDLRLAALKKAGQGREAVARVILSPKNAKIRLRYAVEGQAWTPRYDLRLNNKGVGRVTLFGQLPSWHDGYLLQAMPGKLAEATTVKPIVVPAGAMAPLAEYLMPVREESFTEGLHPSFSFVLTNQSKEHLPPGEAALYRNGEYLGRFSFAGLSSARSRQIVSENTR